MKWLGITILFIIAFFLAGYFGTDIYFKKIGEGNVLSENIENDQDKISPAPTMTPSPSPTLTPTPTPSPTPKPTNTPTPTTIPQPKFSSQEIQGFMERFAGQYGDDVNILRHIAVCESGFNPSSINGPYAGLFQFNKTTWKNNRLLMGEDTNPDLRLNAEESTQTAAYLISRGKRYLWPNCYP